MSERTHSISVRRIAVVVGILSLAMFLRVGTILFTEVENPIRADAADYISYAYNILHHSTYSRTRTDPKLYTVSESLTPTPDAIRTPGYPLFLTLFRSIEPIERMISSVQLTQLAISLITVLLVIVIGIQFLPKYLALGAAVLTAISPHLINANIYLLTETVYGFLLVLFVVTVSRIESEKTWKVLFLAGVLIAATALVRPTMQYFALVLAALVWGQGRHKRSLRQGSIILLGFLVVFSPWLIRNFVTLGKVSDSRLMINTLHHGMYPDFKYQNQPRSFGFPYKADPNSKTVSSSTDSIVAEIVRRFREQPARHLKWYLLGKPIGFLQWSTIQGMGGPFIYQVRSSPYAENGFYIFSYKLMYHIHSTIMFLGLLGSVLIWIPAISRKLKGRGSFVAKTTSLIILYHLAIHTIGFPLPRYSIPIYPLIYLMAMLAVTSIVRPIFYRLKKS